MKNKLGLVLLIILSDLMVSSSSSAVTRAEDQIKIDVKYSPKSKFIHLSVTNIGETPITIYNSVSQSGRQGVPAFFSVKIRNKNNRILSHIPLAVDGFISSNAFVSSLFPTPAEPITLAAHHSITRKIHFNALILGFESHLHPLSSVKDIKLRYLVFLDEQLSKHITYTSEWLSFTEN